MRVVLVISVLLIAGCGGEPRPTPLPASMADEANEELGRAARFCPTLRCQQGLAERNEQGATMRSRATNEDGVRRLSEAAEIVVEIGEPRLSRQPTLPRELADARLRRQR